MNFSYFFDLLLALLLGGLIGLEREWARKEAGLRTFSLVSLGSALFCLLSRIGIEKYLGMTNLDPLRVLSQVIVGIGFLGAGIIIFREKEGVLTGLTTAADIWVTAGIGASVGLGYYELAIFTTLLVLLVLFIIPPFERRIEKKIKEIKEKPL
ncbi:MAG: MgtC/SapB family protein [Candidatus Paceibacterota bacterium]